MCASEINRLHKILDDAGIKLGAVVSDINGVSARAMVKGLIEGQPQALLLAQARGALKHKTEALAASLDGDLSARHLFVLKHIHAHVEALQRELAEIDAYLIGAMQPYAWAHGKAEGNYSAYVPDLPGCIATGGSLEEVESEMQEAIAFHIEGMREDGVPIPEPSSQVEYVEVGV